MLSPGENLIMKIRAIHFETRQPIDITIDGPLIASITPVECPETEVAALPYVAPGFFDIQVNGYAGSWFSSPHLTVQQVADTTQALVNRGIAQFFPTLITASFEALHHGFTTLQKACGSVPLVNDCVVGYHLEGPYISAEDGPRGAHPIKHVRGTDYDEFSRLQDAAGGRIRLITLAAEATNATTFIRKVKEQGVMVAIGHTAATSDQIRAAVDAGATLSTHFGNGAHGMLPRHPNYLWDQLADERLWASVIADGWHVPQSVLKCVTKCKTLERTVLTCDVSGFAGCAAGVYSEGDVDVEVLNDGRLVVAGQRQYLAGSGATTGDCIVHMMKACEISLAEAVRMATSNPEKLTGREISLLAATHVATLSVFHITNDPDGGNFRFLPIQTFVRGQLRSNAESA